MKTNKMQRIPLSERLLKAEKDIKDITTDYLRIPCIFVDDYLTALGKMNGTDYSALLDEIENKYGLIPCMANFVIESRMLDMLEEERMFLLYRLLIEPFAEIEYF